jgi:ChrB-like protein
LFTTKPTNLRGRTLRNLQTLGATAIKNSVYLLPINDKSFEDFQWLKQEIESAGGEATVFNAGAIEGATDDEIVASFRTARAEEYSFGTPNSMESQEPSVNRNATAISPSDGARVTRPSSTDR